MGGDGTQEYSNIKSKLGTKAEQNEWGLHTLKIFPWCLVQDPPLTYSNSMIFFLSQPAHSKLDVRNQKL